MKMWWFKEWKAGELNNPSYSEGKTPFQEKKEIRQYVQHTQADETPKAGLVVQGIPGHAHKVTSLGQLENVQSKKKSFCLHILCCTFTLKSKILPFLGNRIVMKSSQVISSMKSDEIQILQYLLAKYAACVPSHLTLNSQKRRCIYGNACCVLAWLKITQWDYTDKMVCQNITVIINKAEMFLPFSSDESWILTLNHCSL